MIEFSQLGLGQLCVFSYLCVTFMFLLGSAQRGSSCLEQARLLAGHWSGEPSQIA